MDTPPKVSGDGKNGFFMKHKNEIVILDNVSTAWLRLKSEITHKSTTEIIGDLVREKIAAADSDMALAGQTANK